MSYFDIPVQSEFDDSQSECTCGECPEFKVSQRINARIRYGALQAMHDLRNEFERLGPNAVLDENDLGSGYPYNWLPPNARNPQREALVGAHNILFVIYVALQEGELPDTAKIRREISKADSELPYTQEYIQCGGSVTYILEQLTSQVEGDLRGEACYVDSDDLIEILEQIRPCALDYDLQHWREALNLL
ncbi:hypothetical protein GGI15_000227 [Coemansia interrupta]|uniref:Uncharacterized protein n=1 Tax=Coemansia interrupta TaxID=1126814 RepID=A0A9W8HME4_9FUNG|nr:hypothetical protein GGI15_000227 [Coemansia interrupta]